jgi:glycosyltransferase involved in cell wall biosynthesis
MAAGCPVITTTGGALPEVVGDAGLLVEPGSATALAEAMDRVADDPELRSKLARMGLARAREFTWERTAARTLEVYEEAAAG